MATWLLAFLGIIVALLLLDLAIHLFYAWAALPFLECGPVFMALPPVETGIEPELISVPTSDGLHLRGGVYYPASGHPCGIIVFCPETHATFATAMNYAAALVEAGYAVVSTTFRNQANSECLSTYRATHWLSEFEVADVNSVLDFVTAQPQFAGLPIGLFGVSRGAGAALAAGARRREVRCVWAQGPFSSHRLVQHFSLKWVATVVGERAWLIPRWHVKITSWFMLKMIEWRNGCRYPRIEPALAKWGNREAYFVRGARDNYVPEEMTNQLCRLSGHAPETNLWVVPRAKHNRERLADPQEFDNRVVRFFDRSLLPESRRRVEHGQRVATT